MKKEVTVDQRCCDVCGNKAETWNACNECGKDFCYDCRKVHSKEYVHRVHFSGSGDGIYCSDCDLKLRANGDEKHAAYVKIQDLRAEEKAWYSDFQGRVDVAEQRLKNCGE